MHTLVPLVMTVELVHLIRGLRTSKRAVVMSSCAASWGQVEVLGAWHKLPQAVLVSTQRGGLGLMHLLVGVSNTGVVLTNRLGGGFTMTEGYGAALSVRLVSHATSRLPARGVAQGRGRV